MDSQLIQRKSREAYQPRIVGVDARLVADIDTHIRGTSSSRILLVID
jgi:hypothetical protein